MPAREQVVRGLPGQRGLLVTALVGGPAAPRREPAAGRWLGQIRWQPADREQPPVAVLAQPGNGGQQGTGVGMVHVLEEVRRTGDLDHPARVHHLDPVRMPGDHAHVVRDQQHRHAEAVLEVVQQGEDLRLDGDVQGGRGLVGDQQLGLTTQRHRDHHPLAHAAGELVRVVAEPLGRPWQADQAEHLGRLGPGRCLARPLVQPDRLGHLVADRLRGVQRGERVLEDHGDVVAADRAQLGIAQADQFPAVQLDRAVDDRPARRQQPHDGQARHRLPAARLAHQPEGLSRLDGQIDVADGVDDRLGELDVRGQIADLEDWGHPGYSWVGGLAGGSYGMKRAVTGGAA